MSFSYSRTKHFKSFLTKTLAKDTLIDLPTDDQQVELVVSEDEFNNIVEMFQKVSNVHKILFPDKSMPSVVYIAHKIFELRALDHLDRVPLFNTVTKLQYIDKQWKDICDYLEWEFNRSV